MAAVETETVPLVKAVASNDLKAVTALLAGAADANAKNSVEIPVLVMAIRSGSTPIVDTLLKSKADPNVRDVDNDSTPLVEAINLQELDRAADIVKMLLAAGADVNAASRKEGDLLIGMTPLMFAAAKGSEDLVQLLIHKGADVNAKTASGFTALWWAKIDESKAKIETTKGVIRRLQAAGAKN